MSTIFRRTSCCAIGVPPLREYWLSAGRTGRTSQLSATLCRAVHANEKGGSCRRNGSFPQVYELFAGVGSVGHVQLGGAIGSDAEPHILHGGQCVAHGLARRNGLHGLADSQSHTLSVLLHSAGHGAFGDQGLGVLGGVHAEHGDNVTAVLVVALALQGGHNALSHAVVVADDQLDHVAVGLVVGDEVGLHVVGSGSSGPLAALVHLVLVGVVGVEVLQFGLSGSGQDGIGVLHAVLGPVDGLHVGLVALHHGVADLAVLVQVDLIVVSQDVVADHLALHVAGFGSVGADEAGGVGTLQDFHVRAIGADGTVEENNGDVASQVQDVLGHVGGTGSNHVHHQQIGATGDSGLNLVKLLRLVTGGVLIVVLHTDSIQLVVQFGTHGAQIHVALVIPENGNLRFAVNGAVAAFRAIAAIGAAVGAAGAQAQDHHGCQQQCKDLLHFIFLH